MWWLSGVKGMWGEAFGVCRAKRPAVGGYLLTISPWKVAPHTRTHTLFKDHI